LVNTIQEEKIRPKKSSLGKENNEEEEEKKKEEKKQTEIFILFFSTQLISIYNKSIKRKLSIQINLIG
jgi:hypothetical protein